MSPQKRGVRTQISEVWRQSRAPWWHCKRRLWNLCIFFWTGLVCVPADCREDHGCYCKTTRLRRTSSWRSIRVHSGKIGGRSQIAQNSKDTLSRRMDTSSTTQMAEIRWKFVWTPTSRIVVGKTVRRNSIGTWMEKSTELGMSVCSSKTRIILIGFCG